MATSCDYFVICPEKFTIENGRAALIYARPRCIFSTIFTLQILQMISKDTGYLQPRRLAPLKVDS